MILCFYSKPVIFGLLIIRLNMRGDFGEIFSNQIKILILIKRINWFDV